MMRTAQTAPVTALIAQVLLIAALAITVSLSGAGLSPAAWAVGVSCGVITNAALARGLCYYRTDRLGPADWVTLVRATLVVGIAALIADSFGEPTPVTPLVSLAALALVLDAVDGWVARRTRTAAALGAHFDAEVDAFLILILSVYVARFAGAWVLAIGAARYAFLAAGWLLPWMHEQLPSRHWRKVVCATQGIVLTVAAAGILSPALAKGALVVALVLLAESFGRDVWWLRSNRDRAHPRIVTPTSGDKVDPPGSHGPVRKGVVLGLTILAAVIVWAALVAPYEPKDLTLNGFFARPGPSVLPRGIVERGSNDRSARAHASSCDRSDLEEKAVSTTAPETTVDPAAAFTGRVLADSAATATVVLAALGDRLGLFAALAADGAAGSNEPATRTGTDERYVREWAAGLVAAGYLERDPIDGRITLPAADVPTLAQEAGPAFFGGVHQELVGAIQRFHRVADAFRTGGGIAPEDLHEDVWLGTERFTAGWHSHLLVQQWLPLMPRVQERLRAGARVADVGCAPGAARSRSPRRSPRAQSSGTTRTPRSSIAPVH